MRSEFSKPTLPSFLDQTLDKLNAAERVIAQLKNALSQQGFALNEKDALLEEAHEAIRHMQQLAEKLPDDGDFGLREAILESASQMLVKLSTKETDNDKA